MGVKLKELFTPKNITLENLNGRRIGIDAHNTIYQFITTIRQEDGTPLKDAEGNITSHLSGLFYRTINLLSYGIKPCYIFDGKPPELKIAELEKRKKKKIQARIDYDEAIRTGDLEKAKTKASQTSRITEEIITESKELLQKIGIPAIQAPSEGEAQAAYMANCNDIYAAASQDYDSLLFGAQKLIRNVNITGKRKLPGKNAYITINPQIIELDDLLKQLKITREQLILLGMLVGTDFNDGVRGIGPKKALKIVQEEKTLEKIKQKTNWQNENLEKIKNFFQKPPVTNEYTLKWEDIDEQGIKKILIDRHNFSETRIDNILKRLVQDKEKKTQKTLTGF